MKAVQLYLTLAKTLGAQLIAVVLVGQHCFWLEEEEEEEERMQMGGSPFGWTEGWRAKPRGQRAD